MSTASNLYAQKVFSEHPISLWPLDDTADYVSLISEFQRNVALTRVKNGTHPFLGKEITKKQFENGTHSSMKEYIEKWMDENSYVSQLAGTNILPFRPSIGMLVNINRVDIPEKIFPKEFEAITKAYFSAMKKMDEHYKRKKIKAEK